MPSLIQMNELDRQEEEFPITHNLQLYTFLSQVSLSRVFFPIAAMVCYGMLITMFISMESFSTRDFLSRGVVWPAWLRNAPPSINWIYRNRSRQSGGNIGAGMSVGCTWDLFFQENKSPAETNGLQYNTDITVNSKRELLPSLSPLLSNH